MTVSTETTVSLIAASGRARVFSPLWLLGAALLGCIALLALPIRLPIGPMYWDVYIYYDAANRIASGQVPALDFFTPVGPLGYYLFAALNYVFPNAQPTLIAHWALLLVSAPLMALVVYDVDKRSRLTAFGLLLPFLLYVLLPFNTREFYVFPGSDGFGIYNRQICHILYILIAALLFVKDRRLLLVLTCLCMIALFFLKITGFVAGGLICLFAFAAGRVSFRAGVIIFAGFLASLAVAQLLGGLVAAYVGDILILLDMNSETLAPRFLQATSLNFGITISSLLLCAVLAWISFGETRARAGDGFVAKVSHWLDQDWIWLLVVLAAGILFETQNTGSQALIFLAPVLILILTERRRLLASKPAVYAAIVLFAAVIAVPPAISVTEKAARAYVGSALAFGLQNNNLKTLGAVTTRPEVLQRSTDMMSLYARHRSMFDEVVAAGDLPSPMLYSNFDFQISYLRAVDQAIDAVRALEQDKGVRFETMMSINFTNPFPWLMDRTAPRYIAIGADPFRAVPPPESDEEQAVADVDIALLPTCPPTTANVALSRLYAKPLANHKRIQLTPCYDAFVNPKFAGSLGL
ncbi:hypothetical protein C9W97_24875 [Salmonella enterica subsp. enterica serovar Enteritidis]|nr:hypothetical protein [Salmonella enterica subsp. enterica serovar Enteritidis]